MNPNTDPPTSRRKFLKTSTAFVGSALAAPAFLTTARSADQSPASANDTSAPHHDALRLGLIGCGGRGSGAAAQALTADSNVVLTAMGDAFEDRLQSSLANLRQSHPARVRIEPDHCFVGFDAYEKVLASGVDVVILATPPGFRPMHLKAAVAAGKHIFTEKPMAVDGPGVRSVLASAEEAKRKKLSLVAGFCYRYHPGVREFMKQLHDGAIGEITTLQTTYNTGLLWSKPRLPGMTDMQWQMRNWYYFPWLSGDHIVEQAVHNLDKMAWVMKDVPPKQCWATGGRQVRTAPEFGCIYDHFAVTYEYENGARGYHYCRQQANCYNDNSDYFVGTKGIGHIVRAFNGPYIVKPTNGEPWRFKENEPRDMYQVEHDELFASIRDGKPINNGVSMAHSTLLAIMGRTAAYTGQLVTWDQALNSEESLMPKDLSWDAPPPAPSVPMPGVGNFA